MRVEQLLALGVDQQHLGPGVLRRCSGSPARPAGSSPAPAPGPSRTRRRMTSAAGRSCGDTIATRPPTGTPSSSSLAACAAARSASSRVGQLAQRRGRLVGLVHHGDPLAVHELGAVQKVRRSCQRVLHWECHPSTPLDPSHSIGSRGPRVTCEPAKQRSRRRATRRCGQPWITNWLWNREVMDATRLLDTTLRRAGRSDPAGDPGPPGRRSRRA